MDTDTDPTYARVADTLRRLAQAVERGETPSRETAAEWMGMSTTAAARRFRHYAGLTPSGVVGALTGAGLQDDAPRPRNTLDWAWDLGLSGTGRLHDQVLIETGMTPGEVAAQGAGIPMAVGLHPSPFGLALVAATPRGLAELAFRASPSPDRALTAVRRRWPEARVHYDESSTAPWAARALPHALGFPSGPLALHVRGTAFQRAVWRALLDIPVGETTTYGALASAIGRPGAARAVGGAVGANPLAILIPCHRVLGAGGALGGYRWGPSIKRALLAVEGAG